MKFFRSIRKKSKHIIAALTAAVIAIAPFSNFVNAWGENWGYDGSIALAPQDSNIQLYVDYNGPRYHANAKAVIDGNGHYIPVYCIEQGRHLENGEGATRETYGNDNIVTVGSMAGHTVRDAVGIIYTVGYNGENGWGVYDINIYTSGANLGNGNYVKYVATQALIWEAVNNQTFHHSPDPNDPVQQAINELRARLTDYEHRSDRVSWNGSGITLYDSPAEAIAHANSQTSVDFDGSTYTFHFGYNYGPEYNPSNYSFSSNTNYIVNRSDSDFTLTQNAFGQTVVLGWDLQWGVNAESITGGYYALNDVQLWRPSGANDQLCISATATRPVRYAAFNAIDTRQPYRANATIETVKVDDQGNLASGATFTVYNSDGSVFGTMSDSTEAGHYTIDIPATVFEDEDGYYYDEDYAGNPITSTINRNFTVVETSPATRVNINGTWQNATFADNSATTFTITTSLNRQTGEMTWAASGSNGGTATRNAARRLTHADISFGTSNGNTVNVPYMNASYSFEIAKVDDTGRSARGAVFTVYSDSACTNAVGTMTDSSNNGIYTYSGTFADQLRTTTADQNVTLYVRETAAATQILYDNTWVDVECGLDDTVHAVAISWNPATGSMTATMDADNTITATRSASSFTTTLDADWTSNPIVNSPYMTADYSFELAKIDDMGRDARGAEFTVYSDEDCTDVVGTMTDSANNGIYTFSGSFDAELRITDEDQVITLYVKETAAADQVLYGNSWVDVECELDDTVHTVVITWNPNTGDITATIDDSREVSSARDESSFTSSLVADWTDEPIVNNVMTSGSLTIEKQDDQTGDALTGAVFAVYVDVDGNSAFDPTIDTAFAQITDEDGDGIYILSDLPIQKYIVRELIAPDGYEIDPNNYYFEIVPGHLDVVLDNIDYTVLDTTAGIFVDGNAITGTEFLSINESSHMLVYAEEATFIDHVSYNGLIVGQTYESVAVVYDKATGEPLRDANGNIVTNTVVFTAEETTGMIEVPLTINTLAFESGKTIVCFEDLYRQTANGRVHVGVHHDINDENQTITPPSGATTFMGTATGTHVAPADSSVSLTDVVEYEGLEVGKSYTVTGTIMIKNGEEQPTELRDANGRVITATTTFTATATSGTVNVVFENIDTASLVGKDLVAFESISTSGTTVWIHADINDENQTVEVPNMGTTATVDGRKVFNPSETVTLNDVVAYENLVPGQTYELVGTLMNRNTGEVFRNGDNAVTSTVRFTPNEANGEVTVTFTFNGTSLNNNDKLVVFERLYLVSTAVDDNGNQTEITTIIITHENINDDNQTVTIEKRATPSTGEVVSMVLPAIGISLLTVGTGIAVFYFVRRKEEKSVLE